MDPKKFEDLLPDYVLGMLPDTIMQDMEEFSRSNDVAKALLAEWADISKTLDEVDSEPSAKMDTVFYKMLDASDDRTETKLAESATSVRLRILHLFSYVAAAALVLFLGFWVGKNWNNAGELPNPVTRQISAIEAAEKETEEVRTQLVISLADQPSASKRLEALSEVNKLSEATDKVVEALFKMLNTDDNVNVRLAAVTSLSKYVDNPKVREGLVMSITEQESPLVQIALAELMVTLQEQKSINSMETLLQKPDINEAVKHKLEESIKQII